MKLRLRWTVRRTGTNELSTRFVATKAEAEAQIRTYSFSPTKDWEPVRVQVLK